MNLRCMYCQTMFGVSREVMLIGLQTMEAEKLDHYDIHCPKCRRANRVERRKLELANPNWQENLKKMAKEAEKEAAAEEKPATTSKEKTSTAKKSTTTKSSAETKKSTAKSAPKAKKTTSKAKAK